jgi:hypothetical protein
MLQGVRDGDMSPFAKVVHVYPRFGPTQFAAKVSFTAYSPTMVDFLTMHI